MIIFPLEFMKNAEMYYPGTLALCEPGFSEEQRRLILNVSGVKAADDRGRLGYQRRDAGGKSGDGDQAGRGTSAELLLRRTGAISDFHL